MHIEVFTDGSATTKENPGGWASVILIDGEKYTEIYGYMPNSSNNDAELEAAIQGLAATLKIINDKKQLLCFGGADQEQIDRLSSKWNVTLISDSQLILGWADGSYKFKQADKIEKFKQLQFLVKRLNVKTQWVEGHSGNEHNERCDKLANEARVGFIKKKEREQALIAGNTLIGTKKSGTICLWYKGALKIIDLETNIVENYNRDIHGSRGALLEVREEKSR
jgi:ribonuclease HI